MMAHQQQSDSSFLKSPPPAAGEWMQLPPLSYCTGMPAGCWSYLKTVEVYIRECYELLYADIQDYFALGQRFIHIAGNPCTGKSCFLWYVLARILNDPAERRNAIILQLVELGGIRGTFEILPGDDGPKQIHDPEASSYYSQAGTWLLTDQQFVGHAAARTVLFASNSGVAIELLDERKFTSLFMPPWSLEELKVFFFRGRPRPRTKPDVDEFWLRFYLSGSIVGWYHSPIERVYSDLLTRVKRVVSSVRSVNAALFYEDRKEEFSHPIFCSWPSLDFTLVKSYSFVSAFVVDCFATAYLQGDLQNWSTDLLKLSNYPNLESAAEVLLERCAHLSLSQGGGTNIPEGLETDKLTSRKQSRARMWRRPPGIQSEPAANNAKRKVTKTPFQMTVPALKLHTALHVLRQHVEKTIVYERDYAGQVVDGTDTSAEEFVNIDSEWYNDGDEPGQIRVLVRRGEGSVYYEEMGDDNEPAFAASVNAIRSDGVEETTVVTIDCTAGQLDKRGELRIFIHERGGTNQSIRYTRPFMIPIGVSTASDGHEYEVTLDATNKLTVKIMCKGDRCRTSKHFGICFGE